MANYQKDYQTLFSGNDDSETPPEHDVIFHVAPQKPRWNHIEDLDAFFQKVYKYHQKHGFLCILTSEIFAIISYIFLISFFIYIGNCVDYSKLSNPPVHEITDLFIPVRNCAKRFNVLTWICLAVAILYGVYILISTISRIISFFEIHQFYINALRISPDELANTTWHEVQSKLRDVQREQQMCIHKQDLSELDIYQRLLRHENYMVSLINKNLLPVKYNIKFLGEVVYFPCGLRRNVEHLLFYSPVSPFKSTWQLKEDHRKLNMMEELAKRMSRYILLVGLVNLALAPFIFLWQLLSFGYNNAARIRNDPSFLGARRWSEYAKLYLRHFNELDHEAKARLNRAYNPACHYISSFTSHLWEILAKNIVGICGLTGIYILVLGLLQPQIYEVGYFLAVLFIITFVCRAALASLPKENLVFLPEALMARILVHIHYASPTWKNKAHTLNVRNEFSQLFQLKATYIMEELLSPLFTPLILIFRMRHHSLDIVNFFRNFTVEVAGVGDVCSFSLMDVSKHGNYQWAGDTKTNANQYQQAEDGKTELSLMHFTVTNPHWQPPPSSNVFITNLREQAGRDAGGLLEGDENALASLSSLLAAGSDYETYVEGLTTNLLGGRLNKATSPLARSIVNTTSIRPTAGMRSIVNTTSMRPTACARGAVSLLEGPLHTSHHDGILSSLPNQAGDTEALVNHSAQEMLNPTECRAMEMGIGALYMRELCCQRMESERESRSLSLNVQQPQPQQPNRTRAGSECQPLLVSKSSRC